MGLFSQIEPGVAAVLLTQCIAAAGTMAVMPALPFFAMQHLRASALEVAMLSSCYNFAQMIFSPSIGALSDRVGRKWVMLGGLLFQAFCNAFQAEAESPEALLMARGLVGIAMSTGPVEMAYIMDFTRNETQLSQTLALQRVVCNAGALCGPLIAHMFDRFPNGFPALCRALACINLSCLLIGSLLWESKSARSADDDFEEASSSSSSRRPAQRATGGAPGMRDNWLEVLFNGGLCYLLAISFAFTFSAGISDGPEPLFLKDRFGFGQAQFGWFFMVSNASTLIWSPMVPLLISHVGSLKACAAGCLGNSAATVFIIALQGVPLVPYIYAAATVGLFSSMVGLGFMGLVSKTCPKHLLGTTLGLKTSLDGMAGTAAPAVGGCLYYVARMLPYTATAAVSALVAFLYVSLPASVSKKDLSEELKMLKVPRKAKEDKEADQQTSHKGMRRIASAGLPMTTYAGKNFSSQCLLNQISLVMDPELKDLYNRTVGKIEKEKGRTSSGSGMRPSATVATGLCATEAARTYEHDRNLSEAKRGVGGASADQLAQQHRELSP
eukprot:TRINITY_DN62549_c0_g1_i1.p1 TRINITY_DN62549_c0_g1~~TRINITY_DN62549_c0_g1_i1.p1  ORF type:complete len:554 (-),score=103.23 TRINITY_DN62549_c0_g1_i1:48-1709(-)